jgi:hypothetical protein
MWKVNSITCLLDTLDVFIPAESCFYATILTHHVWHSFFRKTGYFQFIKKLVNVFVMAWHIWKDNIKVDLNELGPDDADRICLA